MTKIVGLDNMTYGQLSEAVRRGAKFVYFEYCFSIIVMTFKRPTDIYYIAPGEGTFGKSLPFTAISFFLGWWGFPWGFIHTPAALFNNLRGGKDVTAEAMKSLGTYEAVQAFDNPPPPNRDTRPDVSPPA